MKSKNLKYFIITTFVTLYFIVSLISTIHVIDFFQLSNPSWLAISLAIAFEIGAAASLASLIALEKMSKGLVWFLFIILTFMQMMGNTYYAFTHLSNFQGWVDLFGLTDEDPIYQKRVLSVISGAILPLVALGFIKSLVDYIKPDTSITTTIQEPQIPIDEAYDTYQEQVASAIKTAKEVKNKKEKKASEEALPSANTSMNPQVMPGVNM